MKPTVSKILAFAFLFTSAASCKKNDTGTGTLAKSKTILLTQGSWKIQSFGIDADKDGKIDEGSDYTSVIPACRLDNIYTFKPDGSGSTDESTTKCSDGDPQTTAFAWLFKNNETVLSGTFVVTDGISNGDGTIIAISDTSLVVNYYSNFGGPGFYYTTTILKH